MTSLQLKRVNISYVMLSNKRIICYFL